MIKKRKIRHKYQTKEPHIKRCERETSSNLQVLVVALFLIGLFLICLLVYYEQMATQNSQLITTCVNQLTICLEQELSCLKDLNIVLNTLINK
jgi:maltodextrin utilization protein YvdJ